MHYAPYAFAAIIFTLFFDNIDAFDCHILMMPYEDAISFAIAAFHIFISYAADTILLFAILYYHFHTLHIDFFISQRH